MNIDKTIYGFILGMILPPITAMIFYKFVYTGVRDFWGFIDGLIFVDSASTLLAVCCLGNLAVFTFLAHINKVKITRGIFLATVVYGLAVLILKFGIQ